MSKQTQLEGVVVLKTLAYAHRYLHESIIGPVENNGLDQMVRSASVQAAFHKAVLELAAYLRNPR